MEFKNSGLVTFETFKRSQSLPTGIIICGLPRSGTTGLAKCFQEAGFSLGSNLSNVIEDQSFRKCLSPFNQEEFEAYSLQRSSTGSSLPWVAKFPEAYKDLHQLAGRKELAIIAVSRDPLAIAKRNNISVFQDISFLIRKAASEYSTLINSILSAPFLANISILSYEKLLTSPDALLEELFTWLGFSDSLSEELSTKAKKGIILNNLAYLAESNLIPLYAVDSFTREKISGWCFYQAAPSRRVELQLMCNNSCIHEFMCDLFRPDLVELLRHGKCGFNLELPSKLPDSFPKSCSLIIKGTTHELNLSAKK